MSIIKTDCLSPATKGLRVPASKTSSGNQSTATSQEPTPRWVKIGAALVLAAVLLIAVALLVGGGEHGPGRHSGGDSPPAGADGHVPPPEHAPPAE
jgi:hypothetical protein